MSNCKNSKQTKKVKTKAEDCSVLSLVELRRIGLFDNPDKWLSIDWKDRSSNIINQANVNIQIDWGSNEFYARVVMSIFNYHPADLDIRIGLLWIPRHFGGRRWYFACPLRKNGKVCGHRVTKLYLPPESTTFFGCVRCYNLTYQTTCEGSQQRQFRQYFKKRQKEQEKLFDTAFLKKDRPPPEKTIASFEDLAKSETISELDKTHSI